MTDTLIDNETTTVSRLLPQYNVIVYNCDCHSFDGVVMALCQILHMGVEEAKSKAFEIHVSGRAIVATANAEVAELYCTRLQTETRNIMGYGLRASIEPAA
jgi:ATP-dependent Clp protease adapter protein ClpS